MIPVHLLKMFTCMFLNFLEQTYVIFLAKLKKPHFAPGPESSECQLFALEDIPFDSLAFSSMLVTLNLVWDCFFFFLSAIIYGIHSVSFHQICILLSYGVLSFCGCSILKMLRLEDLSSTMVPLIKGNFSLCQLNKKKINKLLHL